MSNSLNAPSDQDADEEELTEEEWVARNQESTRMYSGFIENVEGDPEKFYRHFGLSRREATGDVQVDETGLFSDDALKAATKKSYRPAFKKFKVRSRSTGGPIGLPPPCGDLRADVQCQRWLSSRSTARQPGFL